MKYRLMYEVILEVSDDLDLADKSMGIEEMISDLECVDTVMITVEEKIK